MVGITNFLAGSLHCLASASTGRKSIADLFRSMKVGFCPFRGPDAPYTLPQFIPNIVENTAVKTITMVNDADLTLISEFDAWAKAEGAGRALKKYGFDMGSVKVVGADWLRAADASGYRSPKEAQLLGAKIGLIVCAFLGVVIGYVHGKYDDPTHRLFATLWPIAIILGLGAISGALLGSLFGLIGEQTETPAWAEHEYGPQLRKGAYLLLVLGDQTILQRARDALAAANPVSQRIRPTRD